jgi:2-polyprenyl-6-methoxyphenol hydroxylase-like FAD-dependent oxidoreductase
LGHCAVFSWLKEGTTSRFLNTEKVRNCSGTTGTNAGFLDVRSARVVHGRSINMALSNRGRRALAAVGLEDLILESAIPMKGRMLHDLEGRTKSVPYDARSGQVHHIDDVSTYILLLTIFQCIYSISRNYLNKVLLTGNISYMCTRSSHAVIRSLQNWKVTPTSSSTLVTN